MARQCVKRDCSNQPNRGFRVCAIHRPDLLKKQNAALAKAKTIAEASEILQQGSEYSDRENPSSPDEEE